MDSAIRLAGQILVLLTFLSSLGFVVTYHFLARWWETEFGRSLMIYQIAMTVILGLSAFQTFTGFHHSALTVFGLVVFAVVPLALTWRLLVLIRAQRRARRDDDGSRHES